MTIQDFKIRRVKKPVIQPNGKVKRTGRTYYQLIYFTNYWHYKDFDNMTELKIFLKGF